MGGTDSYRLGRLTLGDGDGQGVFGMPLRTLTLAWQMADRREVNEITVTVDGERGVVRVDAVEVPFDAGLDGYPDIEEYLARRGSVVGTAVTLAAEDLFAAIHGANLRPPWLDGDDQQSFVLSVDAGAGRFRAAATWDGHGDTSATVACTATGDARLGVNPGPPARTCSPSTCRPTRASRCGSRPTTGSWPC